MLCELPIPMLTVDGYAGMSYELTHCDYVSMENLAGAKALTRHMIEKGAKRPDVFGDCLHCNGFYTRWQGFCDAPCETGLNYDPIFCVLEPDSAPYGDPLWVERQLRAMPQMPDAFFCANDYLALHLITALKNMRLSIPEDVMVAGFDGSPESAVVTPTLTTAGIPSVSIGRMAAAGPGIPAARVAAHTLGVRFVVGALHSADRLFHHRYRLFQSP